MENMSDNIVSSRSPEGPLHFSPSTPIPTQLQSPSVEDTLPDTPNTQTHLSTSTTPPSSKRMRYTPPIRQKTPKPRVQKQKATYGAMAAQMDSSIEPYDSPDAPTIRHIPLTSTPVFPQHDDNAHVITVQIHHQRTPSFEHTTSPPQNNLNLTSIFPLQHTLQHRHTTPTATPSPPELTLQQSDVTPFMKKTTRLKSGWGFGQTNSPLSTARVLIDAVGLCLLRVR